MADSKPSEKTQHEQAADPGAESPTTAQPIDFDDDLQETGVIGQDGTTTTSTTPSKPPRTSSTQHTPQANKGDETAPPKPPRPMDPREQAHATLVEAFPSVDPKVVRAVLDASGGNVENSFHALLRMSDPDYKDEPAAAEVPPPKPPRPSKQQTQMEQDEMYARQLAAHYDAQQHYGQAPRGQPGQPRRYSEEEEDPSSLDDDFAAIRENVRQGFLNTQTTVNKWLTNFKKKIDGEDDEDEIGPGPARPPRQDFGPSKTAQMQGINKMASNPRKSTDQDRYDADPKEIGDDFEALELHDDETKVDSSAKKPQRPLANPDLFKPTPPPPQGGPVDEVDALYSAPSKDRQPSPSGGTKKKWQPLTSVAPAPEGDDNDPFSLGDSDDEEKKQDLRQEDTERLKKAAEQTRRKSSVSESDRRKSLEPHQRSGSNATKDKVAEDLLKGK